MKISKTLFCLLLGIPMFINGMMLNPSDVQVHNKLDNNIQVTFVSGDLKKIEKERLIDTKPKKHVEVDGDTEYIITRTIEDKGEFNIKNFHTIDRIEIYSPSAANRLIITGDKFDKPGTYRVDIFKRLEIEPTAKTMLGKLGKIAYTAGSEAAKMMQKAPAAGSSQTIKDTLTYAIVPTKSLEELKMLPAEPKLEKAHGYEKTVTEAKIKGEEEEKLGRWQNVLDLFKDEKTPTITEADVYKALGLVNPTPEEIMNPKLFPDIKVDESALKKVNQRLQRAFHEDKIGPKFPIHGKGKATIVVQIVNAAKAAIDKKEEERKKAVSS